jgi:hypothetical protein
MGDSALVLHSVGRHMSRSEVFSSLLASRFRIAIEAARGDASSTAPNRFVALLQTIAAATFLHGARRIVQCPARWRTVFEFHQG